MARNGKKMPRLSPGPAPQKRPVVGPRVERDGEDEKLVFRFLRIDYPGIAGIEGDWSEATVEEIASIFRSHESMTWQDILKRTHHDGKSASHFVKVTDLKKAAQDRLLELKLDEWERVFSLRVTGKGRLWGIREGRYFFLLWSDPKHKIHKSSA